MVQQGRIRWTWAAYLMLAAIAVANIGCLAVAAGGAAAVAGYAYYKGKVSRTYPASPAVVHSAILTSVAELQLPVATDEAKPNSGTIECRPPKDTIVISWEQTSNADPAAGPQTEVSIRVGTLGDEGLSTRILDQISFHMIPPGVVPAPPPLGPPQPQVSSAPPPQSAPPPLAK